MLLLSRRSIVFEFQIEKMSFCSYVNPKPDSS